MPDTVRLEQAAAKGPLGTLARINIATSPGNALQKAPRTGGRSPGRGGPERASLRRSDPCGSDSGTPANTRANTPANEKRWLTESSRFGTREGSAGNVLPLSPGHRQKTVDSSRVTEKLQMLGRLEGR
jgi:hypothetical protein